jgi:hypothetical protein
VVGSFLEDHNISKCQIGTLLFFPPESYKVTEYPRYTEEKPKACANRKIDILLK